LRTIAYNSKH